MDPNLTSSSSAGASGAAPVSSGTGTSSGLQRRTSSSNNHTTTAITSTTTSDVASRDSVYCLELAKRSVARAALHLGVATVTQEVLDVLGDVLCSYLERLGSVLAHNVESSGRSSQHVHALDAIRAVELCTSPAVSRVHFTSHGESAAEEADAIPGSAAAAAASASAMDIDEDKNNSKDSSHKNMHHHDHPPGSWQGLAAFCFGPSWQEHEQKEMEVAELQGAGGKVGPKSTFTNQQEESAKDVQEGWRAPFPDEVPHFPVVANRGSVVSNPHSMSHAQVLTALYGKQHAPPLQRTSSNDSSSRMKSPTDIIRSLQQQNEPICRELAGSPEEAQHERQQLETKLGQVPDSVWGGLSNTHSRKDNRERNNEPSSSGDAAKDAASSNGEKKSGDNDNNEKDSSAAGAKRKADDGTGDDKEDTTKSKKEDKDGKDNKDGNGKSDKDKGDSKDDKEDAKPAKKKVRLEDGSAKATKTSTPNSKKKKGKQKDNDDDDSDGDADMKDADDAASKDKANESLSSVAAAAAASASSPSARSSTGKTYNYVPTFYPPIPHLVAGPDGTGLRRKTTVVDLLDRPAAAVARRSSAVATSHEKTPAIATTAADRTATTFGLRSALVSLSSTSYWGSHADDELPAAAAKEEEASKVPAGRTNTPSASASSAAAAAATQGPIVPLGRASGSRASRILEGSMDAAAMP